MFNRLIRLKNTINVSKITTTQPTLFSKSGIINNFNKFYSSNNGVNNNNKYNNKDNIEDCKVICTSKGYSKSIENLPKGFILQKVFDTSNTRLLVEKEGDSIVYVFPSFGCLVSWGASEESLKNILNWVKPYELRPLPAHHIDNFKYKLTNSSFEITKRPQEILHISKNNKQDDASIDGTPSDQEIEMFSSSYAFAQSISLFPLEEKVQELSDIVEHISSTGKINQLPKFEILKQLGEQLKIKSSLNLHSDVLDTPEYFWDHPQGEAIYNQVRSHCEVSKRIRLMNEKLNLIGLNYELINEEKKHKHSIRLERIIIFLIAMEIAITLLRELRDYINDSKSKH